MFSAFQQVLPAALDPWQFSHSNQQVTSAGAGVGLWLCQMGYTGSAGCKISAFQFLRASRVYSLIVLEKSKCSKMAEQGQCFRKKMKIANFSLSQTRPFPYAPCYCLAGTIHTVKGFFSLNEKAPQVTLGFA